MPTKIVTKEHLKAGENILLYHWGWRFFGTHIQVAERATYRTALMLL